MLDFHLACTVNKRKTPIVHVNFVRMIIKKDNEYIIKC